MNSLGGRHISYGVVPKFYKPVIEALLLTFEQCLGEDWNSEINIAWQDALRAITGLMLKGAGQEITPTVEELEDALTQPQIFSNNLMCFRRRSSQQSSSQICS